MLVFSLGGSYTITDGVSKIKFCLQFRNNFDVCAALLSDVVHAYLFLHENTNEK